VAEVPGIRPSPDSFTSVYIRYPMPNQYVELHCHSALSLLDGASLPESLADRAAELGYPALAITDHDEMGGVVRFGTACATLGIGGILGVELTVRMPDIGNPGA